MCGSLGVRWGTRCAPGPAAPARAAHILTHNLTERQRDPVPPSHQHTGERDGHRSPRCARVVLVDRILLLLPARRRSGESGVCPQPELVLRLTHEHEGSPGLVLQNHEQLAVEEANVEEGGGGVRVGPRRIAPRQPRQRERELRQQPRHVDAEQLARLRDRSGK